MVARKWEQLLMMMVIGRKTRNIRNWK